MERLPDQLCGASYDVGLTLRTDATFGNHDATGTIAAVLTATGSRSATGNPPTAFAGTGPPGYEGATFRAKIDCSYVSPVSVPADWTVTLTVTPAGRLQVTWGLAGAGAGLLTTAPVVCPDSPVIPGQPGALLVAPSPLTFELPIAGGQQAVAGGGWFSPDGGVVHTGTLTVTRRT